MARNTFAQEDGQGLIELALLLPILFVIVLGVVDLGKALGYKNDQTNIANQAARLAVVSGGSSCAPCASGQNIAQYVISLAPNELQNGTGSISKRTEKQPAYPMDFTNGGLLVTFTFPNMFGQPGSTCASATVACGYCKGDAVKVTVTSTYNFLSFLVGRGAISPSRDMTSTATMRMETNYDPNNSTAFTPTNDMTGKPACS